LEILKNKGMKICAISSHNICYSCYDMAKIPFSILRKPDSRNWSAYNFRLDKIKESTYLDYLKAVDGKLSGRILKYIRFK